MNKHVELGDGQSQEHAGLLWIVAAPSGAGKTSLVKALLEQDPHISLSVSYTTRPARSGEVDGQDYCFVSEAQFQEKVASGEFLEHAQVFGHFYGTSLHQVNVARSQGRDVLLEIDWQGAAQVRSLIPECRSIFILPPSRAELENRLRKRAKDSEAVIQKRLSKAKEEISHYSEFDFLIVNDIFEQALSDFRTVVNAGRLRRVSQQYRIAKNIQDLLT